MKERKAKSAMALSKESRRLSRMLGPKQKQPSRRTKERATKQAEATKVYVRTCVWRWLTKKAEEVKAVEALLVELAGETVVPKVKSELLPERVQERKYPMRVSRPSLPEALTT